MRTIFSETQDEYLKTLKEELFSPGGDKVAVPDDLKFLVKEWRDSAALGVDRRCARLTEEQRDFRVFDRITEFAKYRLSYILDYYEGREKALASLNCAVFYMDNQYSIFRRAGNARLLDELRDKGIRLGTTLSPENVGVCVANIVAHTPFRTVLRTGHENYLELFEGYACFARSFVEDMRRHTGIIMVVTPLPKLTANLKDVIDFIMSVEDVTHNIRYPFAETKARLMEAKLYNSQPMRMILDKQADVLFTSKRFEETFMKAAVFGPPTNICQFMPELSFLPKYLSNAAPANMVKEVMLADNTKKNRFYFVTTEIISTPDGETGLCCSFQLSQGGKKPLPDGNRYGVELRYSFDSIIGDSPALAAVRQTAQRAAAGNSSVMILGESGTGKEMFAHAIHGASAVSGGPFVPVNCAALPKELLNSELFGYEEGAFTGAIKGGFPGKFEQANGGTIFLDEIGDMPMDMQSSLLRVLEDGVICRVGGKKHIPLNLRFITATNQDLWQSVQSGSFRADLFFRLNIITLKIPPLRERTEDIKVLSAHLLSRLEEKGTGSGLSLAPETLELFRAYSWPGNVRELRNVLERCANAVGSGPITPELLPAELISTLKSSPVRETAESPKYMGGDWKPYRDARIAELMVKCAGNKSKVAKELGVSRSTLYKWMRELGYEVN